MSMSLTGLGGFKITVTGTGTITFPSYISFASGDDYELFVVEGNGHVDVGSKTATGFDFTITTGNSVVLVIPNTPGALAHID